MRYLFLIAFIFSNINLSSAQPSNAINRPSSQPSSASTADLPSLKSVVPFPIGVAVGVKYLRNNVKYRNLVKGQFNSITAENAMKFNALHPAENKFTFANADEIVKFATENNMRIHGHTLLWAMNNPTWIKEFKGDKAAWRNLLKTHIQTIVKHFKGKVTSWDVVNEAFNDGGELKKSIWLEKLGPEYIELAFRFAHEADPDALLFYNDYGHEYLGKRINAIIKMVTDFKRRGVPIHGLGMQMHLVLRIPDQKIQKSINMAASTGLLVHLSEFEISVKHNMPTVFQMTPDLAKQQAQKYKTVFKAYASIPKKQQYGITTWNLGDADSYRNSKGRNHDHPMMFDNDYLPKPAFKAVLESMQRK
jgi:endo-1,4-beta-xylanase